MKNIASKGYYKMIRSFFIDIFFLMFLTPAYGGYRFKVISFNWHVDKKDRHPVIDSVVSTGSSDIPFCFTLQEYKYCGLIITGLEDDFSPIIIRPGLSSKDVADFLNAKRNYKINYLTANADTKLCLFMLGDNLDGNSMIRPVPGDHCFSASPPTPDVSCQANDIEINHGVINPADVNDDRKSGTLSISCSGDASIHLYSASYNPRDGLLLSTNKDLRSYVTLDGQDLSKGMILKLSTSPSSVNVVSTLASSGIVKEGIYQGSLVINIDVQ